MGWPCHGDSEPAQERMPFAPDPRWSHTHSSLLPSLKSQDDVPDGSNDVDRIGLGDGFEAVAARGNVCRGKAAETPIRVRVVTDESHAARHCGVGERRIQESGGWPSEPNERMRSHGRMWSLGGEGSRLRCGPSLNDVSVIGAVSATSGTLDYPS